MDISSGSQLFSRKKFTRDSSNPQLQKDYKLSIEKWETELKEGTIWKVPEEINNKPFEVEEEEYKEDDSSALSYYNTISYSDVLLNPLDRVVDTSDYNFRHTFGPVRGTFQSGLHSSAEMNSVIPDPVPDDHLPTTGSLQNDFYPFVENPVRVGFEPATQSNVPSSLSNSNNANEETTAWSEEEEYHDTMQIPLGDLPVFAFSGGPRLINPNDDAVYSDNNDQDEESDIQSVLKYSRIRDVENLPSFVDSVALYSFKGPTELFILNLDKPMLFNSIVLPPPECNYVVTICYHFTISKRSTIWKGLQIYLSTGESYTVPVERIFVSESLKNSFKNTRLGRLLTDPTLKRVCWKPDFIQNECKKIFGVDLGPCIDLSTQVGPGQIRFADALEEYLKDWDIKPQFNDAKKEYEEMVASKMRTAKIKAFGWDLVKLPQVVLNYSAMHGLATYALYEETLKRVEILEDDKT